MKALTRVKEASWKRRCLWLGVAVIAIFLLIQLVPYGRDHTNPPVLAEARIADPEAQQIWRDSCADCHSNLTTWPWYSNIAPVSWLVQDHVDEGRTKLNFSEWQTMAQPDIGEIREQIESGEMPPWNYTMIHGSMSDKEKQVLVDALANTYRNDPPASIKGD